MAGESQQTSKELAAYTQRHLYRTPCTWSDYTGYSTQNENIMATLRRSYFTMDGQFVFVSSNHNRIPTTESSTHIGHLLGRGGAKEHYGRLDVMVFAVSNAQDSAIPCFKSTRSGNAPSQNCNCLTCSKPQLYLITRLLFFNA